MWDGQWHQVKFVPRELDSSYPKKCRVCKFDLNYDSECLSCKDYDKHVEIDLERDRIEMKGW